jgi:hypothetical protein
MVLPRVLAFVPVLAALAGAAVPPPTSAAPFAKVQSSLGFLSIPQGPRNFAMGYTGVADDASPANVFYNPANIAFYDRVYWNADYVDWPLELYLFDVGVFGGHAFALSGDHELYVAAAARYFRLSSTDDWQRTVYLPDGSDIEFEIADWAVPLSVAAGFTTRYVDFGVGSTVTFVNSKSLDETCSATGLDLGAVARARINPWKSADLSLALGASAVNMGDGPTYNGGESDLPLTYRVGLGIGLAGYKGDSRETAALWRVNGNLDYVDVDSRADFAGGAEFGVLDTVFLRVGHRGDELSANGGYWGFGFSTRIGAVSLSADYAQASSWGFMTDENPQSFGLSGSYRY